MDFNLDSIEEELKNLIKSFPDFFKNKENKSNNLIFQAPIRGTFYNSGGFDPTGKGSVGRIHQGIDLRAPGGTSIYPIANGIVSAVRTDPKGGNTINLKHSNGYTSYYAHLGTISVHPNDQVDLNTIIGTIGDSGNASVGQRGGGLAHIHFQAWKNGSLIDPASLFSVPTYTNFNAQKEKNWLSPQAKEIAHSWNINEHLKNKNNKLANIINQYYKIIIK